MLNNLLNKIVKLACIKHINSVHSEPGPDSSFINFNYQNKFLINLKKI